MMISRTVNETSRLGQVAVELALLFPILIFITFFVFELAILVARQLGVERWSQEAARQLALSPWTTSDEMEMWVREWWEREHPSPFVGSVGLRQLSTLPQEDPYRVSKVVEVIELTVNQPYRSWTPFFSWVRESSAFFLTASVSELRVRPAQG